MNLSDQRIFHVDIVDFEKMSRHDVLDLMNTEHKNTVCHLLGFFFSLGFCLTHFILSMSISVFFFHVRAMERYGAHNTLY